MKRIVLLLTLAFGFSVVGPSSLLRATLAEESQDPTGPNASFVLTPDWFERTGEGKIQHDGDFRIIKGRRSYSESRAIDDAARVLQNALNEWLAPEVPSDWNPPRDRIDASIVSQYVEPVPIDPEQLGLDPTLDLPDVFYLAAFQADFSTERRAELVKAYQQDVGAYRLTVLGGIIAFILAGLGILSAYIRADEATKGYYTNRLRLLAATAAGASAVLIYQLLT